MRSSASVTVVIAAYNAAPYIREAIVSVQAQTLPPDEIIVVDDASTDATVDILRTLSAGDSRIRLVQRSINSGRPAVPRNDALTLARTEFVAFLDADDVWRPEKLADQVAALTREPDLAFVYSSLRAFGGAPWSIENGIKPLPHRAVVTVDDLRASNEIGYSSVMARLDAVRAAGGFDTDPHLAAVEDYALWLSLAQHRPFGYIPRVHGWYRVHPAGLSKQSDMTPRVGYLFNRRGWPAPTSRSLPGTGFRIIRAVAHRITWAGIEIAAWFARRRQWAVPLRRSPARGRA